MSSLFSNPKNPAAFSIRVEGMACDSCVERVEKAIRATPGVVSASVNLATKRAEVTFSGVRGQDVLRAIGLGAKGTMIGRAFLYGLGAMGEAGVRLCLEIIAKELSVTMGFCGIVDINAVDSSALIAPTLIPKLTDGADIGGAMSSVCVPRRSRPFQ